MTFSFCPTDLHSQWWQTQRTKRWPGSHSSSRPSVLWTVSSTSWWYVSSLSQLGASRGRLAQLALAVKHCKGQPLWGFHRARAQSDYQGPHSTQDRSGGCDNSPQDSAGFISHHAFLTCLSWAQGMNSRTNTPVETWKGTKGKQSYTYTIEENATVSFTWAFQRTTLHETVSPSPSQVQSMRQEESWQELMHASECIIFRSQAECLV